MSVPCKDRVALAAGVTKWVRSMALMKTKQLIARQTILDRELPPGTSIVAKGTFPCADPKRIIAGDVHCVDVDIGVRLDVG